MTTQTLLVARAILMDVPRDDLGPLWGRYEDGVRCWCASLYQIPLQKQPERSFWRRPLRGQGGYYLIPQDIHCGLAVEFGLNYPESRGSEPDNPSMGFLTVRSVGNKTRRWYGVVTEIDIAEDGNGHINLVPTQGDVKGCLRYAKIAGLDPVSDAEAELIRDAARMGDLTTLGILHDLLMERNDPRAEALREGMRELIQQLFPGEAKRTNE